MAVPVKIHTPHEWKLLYLSTHKALTIMGDKLKMDILSEICTPWVVCYYTIFREGVRFTTGKPHQPVLYQCYGRNTCTSSCTSPTYTSSVHQSLKKAASTLEILEKNNRLFDNKPQFFILFLYTLKSHVIIILYNNFFELWITQSNLVNLHPSYPYLL